MVSTPSKLPPIITSPSVPGLISRRYPSWIVQRIFNRLTIVRTINATLDPSLPPAVSVAGVPFCTGGRTLVTRSFRGRRNAAFERGSIFSFHQRVDVGRIVGVRHGVMEKEKWTDGGFLSPFAGVIICEME
jgi:hypothetical protein